MTPAAGSEPGGEARLREAADDVRYADGNGTSDYWRGFNDGIDKLVERLAATPPSSVAERAALYDHGRGPLIAGTDVASVAQFDEHAHERPSSVAERGGLREAVAFYRGAALSGERVSDEEDARWMAALAAIPVAATLDVERLIAAENAWRE